MEFDKDEYTTKEAADILGISEFTLRRKIRNKEINVIGKKGKSYIIPKEEIEKFSKKKENVGLANLIIGATAFVAPRSLFSTFESTYMEKLKDIFLGKYDNKDIEYCKILYKSKQKDLNIVKLELEKLMLDKNDTIEYKKNELDLRIQIEAIEKELKIIKMILDRHK